MVPEEGEEEIIGASTGNQSEMEFQAVGAGLRPDSADCVVRVRPRDFFPDAVFGREQSNSTGGTLTRAVAAQSLLPLFSSLPAVNPVSAFGFKEKTRSHLQNSPQDGACKSLRKMGGEENPHLPVLHLPVASGCPCRCVRCPNGRPGRRWTGKWRTGRWEREES